MVLFVDKCLPFGSSISCALFQMVSDGIAHIVQVKIQARIINYLDDYLFVALLRSECNRRVKVFLAVCKTINMPISMSKTFWATTTLTFLRMLIDALNQMVSIPLEKLIKVNQLIDKFLGSKKTTVRALQQLCGYLNFLCKCIVPGRVFTRRLYSGTSSKLKPYHHIKVTGEMKLDLRTWKTFLMHPSAFCRPFADFETAKNASILDWYTDSAENFELGCGGVNGSSWFQIKWDTHWCQQVEPSIEYLELYMLCASILLWVKRYVNSRIVLLCDNQSVVHMVNNNSSKCKNCMVLLQIIVLQGLIHNVQVTAKYVRSLDNGQADALLRGQWDRFDKLSKELGITLEEKPENIPEDIWPMHKLWLN